ncbi:MAG: hypothetical protein HGA28_00095 [Anaerolineaceae bacterium]|jgi:hypothetical protein|nr:hypothetical protein [Anaerolineaceae bacterium]
MSKDQKNIVIMAAYPVSELAQKDFDTLVQMANVALPSIMQQPDLQVEKPESETEIHL